MIANAELSAEEGLVVVLGLAIGKLLCSGCSPKRLASDCVLLVNNQSLGFSLEITPTNDV